MRPRFWTNLIGSSLCVAALWGAVIFLASRSSGLWQGDPAPSGRTVAARGVAISLEPDGKAVVIQHAAIPGFMRAMTMPFNVKTTNELAGLQPGDIITFQLHVTDTQSWVDHIRRIGSTNAAPNLVQQPAPGGDWTAALLNGQFTNERGQPVRLRDYRGQALALTFFYTRCPLPDFCPRLSKNFQEASAALAALPNAAGNWHFFSVTFDPESDTPAALKAYADTYHYDPARWSFLTGDPEQIGALARAAGLNFRPNSGTLDHNFRTIIIDAAGHIQMIFPTGGNLSDQIVSEMLKARSATNNAIVRG